MKRTQTASVGSNPSSEQEGTRDGPPPPDGEGVHEVRRDKLRIVILREACFGWTYRVVVYVTDRFHQEQPLTIPIFQTELPTVITLLTEARGWVEAQVRRDRQGS